MKAFRKDAKEVVLDIPDNINVIAVFSNSFRFYSSEFYDINNDKRVPVIVISSKYKPQWCKVIYNLVARGAYMFDPEKTLYFKYVSVSEKEVNGYIILERTGERINGVPIFKVTNKEPEAILNSIWLKYDTNYENIKINQIINAIDYEGAYVSDEKKFYLAFMVPRNKKVIIDYTINNKNSLKTNDSLSNGRHRWVFWWGKETLEDKNFLYEDINPDEII